MANHRYWRASGLRPYDGGSLVELSELWLLNGTTRVDSGATLTSNVALISGTLGDLQDANSASTATLAAGSTITWDFGTATEVTNMQVGAASSKSRFLLGCAIERSDDGVVWREFQLVRNWQGIRWPGAGALTANVLRIPPIAHTTIRMSFEPASWWLNEFGPAVTFTAFTGCDPLTVSPIKGARSLVFSGTGRLNVASVSAFAFVANTDFTIQAWVRATSSTAGNRVIAAFGGINSASNVAYLALDPSTGVVSLVVTGSTTRFVASPSGAFGALNVNKHVAASSENGVLRVFIDGVLVATTTGASTLGANANPDIAIGNYSGVATNTFLGVIDDVGIDQKALYFSDFTPPTFSVPTPEWQIDAVTAAPALTPRLLIATADGLAGAYGTTKLTSLLLRARPDYSPGRLGQGIGRLHGTTKDKGTPNVPVSERVRLYRMRDGMLMREVWSTPGTGAYSFDYIDEVETYFVISFDHDLAFRAVVADNLNLANGGVELIA